MYTVPSFSKTPGKEEEGEKKKEKEGEEEEDLSAILLTKAIEQIGCEAFLRERGYIRLFSQRRRQTKGKRDKERQRDKK